MMRRLAMVMVVMVSGMAAAETPPTDYLEQAAYHVRVRCWAPAKADTNTFRLFRMEDGAAKTKIDKNALEKMAEGEMDPLDGASQPKGHTLADSSLQPYSPSKAPGREGWRCSSSRRTWW